MKYAIDIVGVFSKSILMILMLYISPPLSLMKPVQWLSNNRPLDMLLWKSQTEEAAVNQTPQTQSLIVSFPKYHRQPSTKIQ